MNGDQLYLDLRVLYMRAAFFSWISHFHLTIHSSHQRLLSAPEFITATSTVRESSVWIS
ncbi:hypothetical protein CIB84_006034 [Bambusicola thoracicus]|uniref:Uncharacterized protein n=1 Tax=Bambusicola thoracicus TaxID=9083 RepID=A0A2P4T1I4_BAMTH|nr:hypothetical protein CIB84_006034 [Bambusicola thoracicus]